MTTNNKMTVFLVDDNELFREALAHKFANFSGLNLVEFSTGENCIKSLHLEPKVILLDYHLNFDVHHAMNGLSTLREVRKIDPDIKVIMLTRVEDEKVINASIESGAKDYIIKDQYAYDKVEKLLKNYLMA